MAMAMEEKCCFIVYGDVAWNHKRNRTKIDKLPNCVSERRARPGPADQPTMTMTMDDHNARQLIFSSERAQNE